MNKRLRTLLPLLVLLAGAALAALIVAARPEVERRAIEAPPPLVRAIVVERLDLPLIVRSQGTVTPNTVASLVAQVAGRIEWVSPSFAEGGFFRRGDTLVRIEDRDYRLALAQAEAQTARARVGLEREQAEAEVARQEWEEIGEGEPTPLTLREPQLAEARATLQAAEAALEKARLDLERTRVRAGFDGRVRSKQADVGQFVAPGTPLGTVYDTASAEVRLPVPKDELAFLALDLAAPDALAGDLSGDAPSVLLRAELAGADRVWSAKVVRTGSEFDPRTRMLPLFARVEDPFALRSGAAGAPLPMGLFVEAEIGGRVARDVVPIPRSALRDANQVLVVDEEDRLRFRRVAILRIEGDRALVREGLEDGERVCVSPLDVVVDGMKVRIEPAAPPVRAPADREAGA